MNREEFITELQKLVPTGVKVEIRTFSDAAFGGREGIFILHEQNPLMQVDENTLCTILPVESPWGMFIGCTVPELLEQVGIDFSTEPRRDHKTVLRIKDSTFLLSTKKQKKGFRWALIAEKQ